MLFHLGCLLFSVFQLMIEYFKVSNRTIFQMRLINNKIFYRSIVFGIGLTLLGGCGGTWSHSYKTENTFLSEKNSCKIQANQAYPPVMSSSSSNCYGYGNNYNCYSNSYDVNVFSRSSFWDDCMRSKGWVYSSN